MDSTPTIDSLLLNASPDLTKPSQFIAQLFQQCSQCVKAAATLPHGADYEMYMSDPTAKDFQNAIQTTQTQLWSTISSLSCQTAHNLSKHVLLNTTNSGERYGLVKQAIGDNLETVNRNLRLIQKYRANTTDINITFNSNPTSDSFSIPVTQGLSKHMLKRMREKNNGVGNAPTKPQILYNHKVDNSYRPFRPILHNKPNALVPLDESIITGTLPPNTFQYPHPYREEIISLQYNKSQVTPVDLYPLQELKSTPCYWVDTIEDLLQLEHCLKQQEVFAIDLEHHSQHSYQGITCLVQISTLSQDFIVDALVLSGKLSILNSSFTNPRIVKVLHGCAMDVLWLQRDFGLYLVNIFDTSQAAKVLEFPKHGLSALLDHYCNIKADKSYQLADWRQRPLNREMLVYAREDTHYLLYIYSRMQNELIDKSNLLLQKLGTTIKNIYPKNIPLNIFNHGICSSNNTAPLTPSEPFQTPFLLAMVLQQSNRIPLTLHEKQNRPVLSACKLFSRLRLSDTISPPIPQDFTAENTPNTPLLDDNTILRLFCAIYSWRDQIARQLDESPGVILKLDHIIRLIRFIPNDPIELQQRISPINIFMRPLVVPLFHLIQGVVQLPSELYNLDLTKMKFSIDTIKDLAEYETNLESDGGHFSKYLKSSKDLHQSGVVEPIDPTIGLPFNKKIQNNRQNYKSGVINTISAQKDDKSKKKSAQTVDSQNQTQTQINSIMTDDTHNHIDMNYWSDDTIAQLENEIITRYSKFRYSHPLYFLPDYVHSLIDNDWARSPGIDDNLEVDVVKLAAEAQWNRPLPQIANADSILGNLNWKAANHVMEYSIKVCNGGIPVTRFGLELFDRNVICPDENGEPNGQKRYQNERKGKQQSPGSKYKSSNLVQLSGIDSVDNGLDKDSGANQSGSSFTIAPITSEKIQTHNKQIVKGIKDQIGYEQCNDIFTVPIKPISDQDDLTAFKLLQLNKGDMLDVKDVKVIEQALKGQTSHKTAHSAPVSTLTTYSTDLNDNDTLNFLSPPRKFNRQDNLNPLFAPAHARIGGAIVSHPDYSLDWDQDDVFNGTPQTSRTGLLSVRKNEGNVGKIDFGGDDDHDDGHDDGHDDDKMGDEDDERIPDIKKQGFGIVPNQLEDIYKLSNLKRNKTGKAGKSDGEESIAASPFSATQMLLNEQSYKIATTLNEDKYFTDEVVDKAVRSNESATFSTAGATPSSEIGKDKTKKSQSAKPAPNSTIGKRNISTAAIPVETTAATATFVVDDTAANPFLNTGRKDILDTKGTIYNPRNIKANQRDNPNSNKGSGYGTAQKKKR
jgi:ribonuclease D